MKTTLETRQSTLRAALSSTLYDLPGVVASHRGKVRDVFVNGNEMLLVTTDRISAFDVVLGTVPLKGALLTAQSAFWLDKAKDVIDTHLIAVEGPQVLRCRRARALPVEFVVRGFLTGSLLREDKSVRGRDYGVTIDVDHPAYAPFAAPLITPTTKEAVGTHDVAISAADVVRSGRMTQHEWDACARAALSLFAMGQVHARHQSLMLVDTKYEFGVVDDDVILIDEIHSADSSRFWRSDTYVQRIAAGEAPDMLDKERLRRWLLSQGFSGNGTPPALSDDVRVDLADHYWQLTEQLTGREFVPPRAADDAVAQLTQQIRTFCERA
jgi:phosphoribosylaminoimidazole-succinocarboxamide synthase